MSSLPAPPVRSLAQSTFLNLSEALILHLQSEDNPTSPTEC